MIPIDNSIFQMDGEIFSVATKDDGSLFMLHWTGKFWEKTDRVSVADIFSADAKRITNEEAVTIGIRVK